MYTGRDMYISLSLSLSLSIYIYIYIYTYVCMCVYIYIYMYMCVSLSPFRPGVDTLDQPVCTSTSPANCFAWVRPPANRIY